MAAMNNLDLNGRMIFEWPALQLERAGLFEAEPVNAAPPILDRFPFGVLIYRLNELLYANAMFLAWCGFSHDGPALMKMMGQRNR